MFREILQQVVDDSDANAGLLMGFDGIPVERYVAGELATEVDAVGIEYSVVLKTIEKAAAMLNTGNTAEVMIRTAALTAIIRPLNAEYFAAITLPPAGGIGKARYLLRMAAPTMIDGLS